MTSFKTAFTAFRRAPLLSALSITTIAFSLFAFGLFGLVALNIRAALQRVEERVEIRAFIADSTSDEEIADAADQIAKFPEVLKVDVVTQNEALERAKKELGEFKDVFEAGVLPASLDVKLKPGNRDPDIGSARRRPSARNRLRRRRALRRRVDHPALQAAEHRRRRRHRARSRVRRGGDDHHRRDDPHGGAGAQPRDLDHAARRRDGRVHQPPLPYRGFDQGRARRRARAGPDVHRDAHARAVSALRDRRSSTAAWRCSAFSSAP